MPHHGQANGLDVQGGVAEVYSIDGGTTFEWTYADGRYVLLGGFNYTDPALAVEAAWAYLGALGGGTLRSRGPGETWTTETQIDSQGARVTWKSDRSLLLYAMDGLNAHVVYVTHDHVTLDRVRTDGNKANQTADMCCILFDGCSHALVEGCEATGAHRETVTWGSNIVFSGVTHGIIRDNLSYDAFYDNIKVRGDSLHCQVLDNKCIDSETKGGIQVSGAGTRHILVEGNQIYQDVHDQDNGVRVHSAKDVNIEGNYIYNDASASVQLIDAAQRVTVKDNQIYTNDIGVDVYGNVPATARPTLCIFKDNTIILGVVGATAGVRIVNGDLNEVKDNTIHGEAGGVGVSFGAVECDQNRLGPNTYHNLATNVVIADDTDVELIDCQVISGSTYAPLPAGQVGNSYGTPIGKASVAGNSEVKMRLLWSKPGIFRNFYVRSDGPATVGDTWEFTYRVNGADTTITTTISGAAQLDAEDRDHSFIIAVQDRLAVRMTATVGTPAAELQWSIQFIPF